MIIHPGADASVWIRAAAAAALALHVGGGGAGLVSGTISMVARKGGRVHRVAGQVFVGSMLVMATMAAVTAPFVPRRGNIVGGVFTVYLVLTGWIAARRPTRPAGWFEAGAALAALAIAALAGWIGWLGSQSPDGQLDGQSVQSAYVVAALALLAGGLDLRALRRGGLSGPQRLVRHLWRLCVAMFMATGSFFLGQQQVLPAFMQGSPLLMAPVLAPLALLAFWQVRLRLRGQPGRSAR